MQIRLIRPDEFETLGHITVDAYRQARAAELGSYEEDLFDVAGRAADCSVLVAVDDDEELLGGVTYVPRSGTALSEFIDPEAAGIRMLAVRSQSQGCGVGRALTEACISRAREEGRRRVVLHSTPAMTRARQLYEQLGFVRWPALDAWVTEPPYSDDDRLHLMAYLLTL